MIMFMRALLLLWLAVSMKTDDDLYGVRYSILNFEKCRRVEKCE